MSSTPFRISYAGQLSRGWYVRTAFTLGNGTSIVVMVVLKKIVGLIHNAPFRSIQIPCRGASPYDVAVWSMRPRPITENQRMNIANRFTNKTELTPIHSNMNPRANEHESMHQWMDQWININESTLMNWSTDQWTYGQISDESVWLREHMHSQMHSYTHKCWRMPCSKTHY